MNTFQVKRAIWGAKRQAKQRAEKAYMALMVQSLLAGEAVLEVGMTQGFRWLVYDEPDWQAQGYTRYRRKRGHGREAMCR